MKGFIKNNLKILVTLIILAILFTGIGVYAASQYYARDITFTPTNENFKKENGEPITNVEDALNELYSKQSYNIEMITNYNNSNVTEYNNIVLNNLDKYNYILVVITTSNRTGKNIDLMDSLIDLTCDDAVYLGKNGAYVGSDSSSHITKTYAIPVKNNSMTINKIIGWSYSIYGI